MTPSRFSVWTAAAFDRSARKLARAHAEFLKHLTGVVAVLSDDPYNHSRRHQIKKLKDVAPGDGQYRIRAGRFRFRYDISGQRVELKSCGLRREDTY